MPFSNATPEAVPVKCSCNRLAVVGYAAAVVCLLVLAGCRPAQSLPVAPEQEAPRGNQPVETTSEDDAAVLPRTADEQDPPVDPREPDEETTGLNPLLRQLQQLNVDYTELDDGYSVGLLGKHLGDDGRIRSEVFELLQQLPRVVSLYLFRADVFDAGLEQVKTFRDLRSFNTTSASLYSKFTDDGIAHLAGLTQLESLGLSGARRVTDASLSVVARLTNLQELYISDCPLTDDGLEQLAALEKLEKLELLNCEHFEGRGLAFLNGRGLRFLDLHGCDTTDAGLSALRELPSLQTFIANYNERLTGPGLAFLAQSPQLQHVSIDSCPELGDAAPQAIANCRELETLDFSETAITDRGVAAMAELQKLDTLDLNHCQHLTDAALATIGGLGNLSELALNRTQVTDEGLRLQTETEHGKRTPQVPHAERYQGHGCRSRSTPAAAAERRNPARLASQANWLRRPASRAPSRARRRTTSHSAQLTAQSQPSPIDMFVTDRVRRSRDAPRWRGQQKLVWQQSAIAGTFRLPP